MTAFAEGIAHKEVLPCQPSPPTHTTATARNHDGLPGAFLLLSLRQPYLALPDGFAYLLVDLANGTCRRADLRADPLYHAAGRWLDQALSRAVMVQRLYTFGAGIVLAAMRQWAASRPAECIRLREWAMPPSAHEVERSFRSDCLRPLIASDDQSLASLQRALAAWRTAYNARAMQAQLPPPSTSH